MRRSPFRSAWFIVAVGAILVLVLAGPATALEWQCQDGLDNDSDGFADGADTDCQCLQTLQSDLVCTAADAGLAVIGLGVQGDGCINADDTVNIWFQGQLEIPNTDRYDVSMWIGLDGTTGSAANGSVCGRQILKPTGTVSGDCDSDPWDGNGIGLPVCSVIDGDGPYWDLNGNGCGDIRYEPWAASMDASATINFVTPDGDPMYYRMPCTPTSNGFLSLSTCAGWAQNAGFYPTCSTFADPMPGSKSKCNCIDVVSDVPVPNISLSGGCQDVSMNDTDGDGVLDPLESITKKVSFVNVNTSGTVCTNPSPSPEERYRCGTASYLRVVVSYPTSMGTMTATSNDPGDRIVNDTVNGRLIWLISNRDVGVTLPSLGVVGPTTTPMELTYTFTKGGTGSGSVTFGTNLYWSNSLDTTSDATIADLSAAVLQTCATCSCSFNAVSTTPVTLASFSAARDAGRVRFDWSTATEVGTVGFDIYGVTDDGPVKLNDEPIQAEAGDSVEPRSYRAELWVPDGVTRFLIDDLEITGDVHRHGPFALGTEAGRRPRLTPVGWDAIRAESASKADRRRRESGERQRAALAAVGIGDTGESTGASPTDGGASGLAVSAAGVSAASSRVRTRVSSIPSIRFAVDRDGLYRVTYEQLAAAGFDLAGVKAASVGLSNRGRAVPIYVGGGSELGPGSFIEFHGRALRSLYTDRNLYELALDAKKPARVAVDTTPVPDVPPVTWATTTRTFGRDRSYSFSSPTGDPWFDTRMLTYTSPRDFRFSFDVDDLVENVGPASLTVHVYGATNLEQDPDHHVAVSLNGWSLGDWTFDDLEDFPIEAALPDGVLRDGANTLEIRLLGDLGTPFDVVNLESWSVTYPRRTHAVDGALDLTAAGDRIEVGGLRWNDIVAYRDAGGTLTRLEGATATTSGLGYVAAVPGTAEPAAYHVTSAGSLLTPAIEAGRTPVDLTAGRADYLVIAHPDFIGGLEPLVAARERQGLTVRVVDVDDVYERYAYGIVDPGAIKAYVADAAARMGITYVLLVGGDTYDYRDVLGTGSVSFIPSLYTATGDVVRYAPTDPTFADLDDDGTPDLAIGRFPVRTSAELDVLVAKTLAYESKGYARTAVFTADAADPVASEPFSGASDRFIAALGANWAVQRYYLDTMTVEGARSGLTGTIDGGVALTSYVGHSGPTMWTFKRLFSTADAAALTNAGMPTAVTQWGCWNTYYVSPTSESLASTLLLSGDRGAAAVLGATTLTDDDSENLLATRLAAVIGQPGMPLGRAILLAKKDLARNHPELADVLAGWTLLGDPALVVQR